jgi:hypothetical protein
MLFVQHGSESVHSLAIGRYSLYTAIYYGSPTQTQSLSCSIPQTKLCAILQEPSFVRINISFDRGGMAEQSADIRDTLRSRRPIGKGSGIDS